MSKYYYQCLGDKYIVYSDDVAMVLDENDDYEVVHITENRVMPEDRLLDDIFSAEMIDKPLTDSERNAIIKKLPQHLRKIFGGILDYVKQIGKEIAHDTRMQKLEQQKSIEWLKRNAPKMKGLMDDIYQNENRLFMLEKMAHNWRLSDQQVQLLSMMLDKNNKWLEKMDLQDSWNSEDPDLVRNNINLKKPKLDIQVKDVPFLAGNKDQQLLLQNLRKRIYLMGVDPHAFNIKVGKGAGEDQYLHITPKSGRESQMVDLIKNIYFP